MPHTTGTQEAQDELDDQLIQQALDPENPLDFSRALEPGEKADDAVNFSDLSDDDLADEEDEGEHGVSHLDARNSLPGTGPINHFDFPQRNERCVDKGFRPGPNGDVLDDLFGDRSSSPAEDGILAEDDGRSNRSAGIIAPFDASEMSRNANGLEFHSFSARLKASEGSDLSSQIKAPIAPVGPKDGSSSKDQRLQEALFAMSGSAIGNVGAMPASQAQDERLAILWPRFERNITPKFMDLLPPKRARYLGKTPLRRPKPVVPTRLNLEVATDQDKSFRLPSMSGRKTQDDGEKNGVVVIQQMSPRRAHQESDDDAESDYGNEPVNDVSWQDLQLICGDWDPETAVDQSSSEVPNIEAAEKDDLFADLPGHLDDQQELPSAKRRKTGPAPSEILRLPQFALPSLHDPENATAKIAQDVTLDLNDTHLLIDYNQPTQSLISPRKSLLQVGSRGTLRKGWSRRYNISNDEAYDLLKENHQSKVRSTLGSMAIDHSTPAIKLQWPFYSTKMRKQQARSFHRPLIQFTRNENARIEKAKFVKRKHLRGRDAQSIFSCAKDLSLGDNSSVLLLEYSEEYPIMLSNFGMGNRLINYYRRKNINDVSRPKLDVGETSVLLPQDKSPFSIFGHIDPGEMTSALHNAMYRAPIFKHEPKSTDFLVLRNRSGEGGHIYHMKNVENLYVVGQEFPSVDVPGPHSRKVTTASKNRLKMVCYRLLRQSDNGQIPVSEVTKHFADTTDMQNRQKMKEFLQFSKESKSWTMRSGEAIPDEDTVRAMVKPEDVCILEAMEVGQQHLQDAGFGKGDDQSEDDEGKEGQSVEQQLAPWYTSRNFLNATQSKAMLKLYGEGDPSGRGEAFSFIKTSMKGGFKVPGESVEERLDAKKLKELGGHSYNVSQQQKIYDESIRRIWEAQKRSLTNATEQSETELEDDESEAVEESNVDLRTPKSEGEPTSIPRRGDDESTSQVSKTTANSQTGKILRISRHVRQYGEVKIQEDIIRDPQVIQLYIRQKLAKDTKNSKVEEYIPTGDPERDQHQRQRLEKELSRLKRNKERRIARDKQKGIYTDGAAESPASPDESRAAVTAAKTAGTQRKCANCGQVGHIKTNKKCSLPSL